MSSFTHALSDAYDGRHIWLAVCDDALRAFSRTAGPRIFRSHGGRREPDSLQADHITKPPHGAEWPASGLGRAALPEPVNENLALGVG